MPGDLLVAISRHRLEHPIAVLGTAPHPVLGLLAVLLALVLSNAGEQVFNEGAVGILAKAYRRRHQHAARLGYGTAERAVGFDIAGEPGEVVNDHRIGTVRRVMQKNQQIPHAGAVGMLAGNIINKNAGNAHAPVPGKFSAAGFLAGEPVALGDLRVIADPAIEDRLFWNRLGFNVHDPPPSAAAASACRTAVLKFE